MVRDASGFVSQAEYGRHRGVSRKTVTDWKQKGILVVDAKGRVDVAMTDVVLDQRPSAYRGGVTSKPAKRRKGNSPPAGYIPPPEFPDDEEALGDEPIDLSEFGLEQAGDWTLAEATRVKEIYLALKRRQDFMTAEKKLVPIEDVVALVEADYSVVRERLLGIPGKIGSSLVGLDQAAIEAAVHEEISEALRELHEPGVDRPPGDGGAPGRSPQAGQADT